jgi:hypothetical protein
LKITPFGCAKLPLQLMLYTTSEKIGCYAKAHTLGRLLQADACPEQSRWCHRRTTHTLWSVRRVGTQYGFRVHFDKCMCGSAGLQLCQCSSSGRRCSARLLWMDLPYGDVQQSCDFSMEIPDTAQEDASMPRSKFSRGLKLLGGEPRYRNY